MAYAERMPLGLSLLRLGVEHLCEDDRLMINFFLPYYIFMVTPMPLTRTGEWWRAPIKCPLANSFHIRVSTSLCSFEADERFCTHK